MLHLFLFTIQLYCCINTEAVCVLSFIKSQREGSHLSNGCGGKTNQIFVCNYWQIKCISNKLSATKASHKRFFYWQKYFFLLLFKIHCFRFLYLHLICLCPFGIWFPILFFFFFEL